jgi:hypothetical protein
MQYLEPANEFNWSRDSSFDTHQNEYKRNKDSQFLSIRIAWASSFKLLKRRHHQ